MICLNIYRVLLFLIFGVIFPVFAFFSPESPIQRYGRTGSTYLELILIKQLFHNKYRYMYKYLLLKEPICPLCTGTVYTYVQVRYGTTYVLHTVPYVPGTALYGTVEPLFIIVRYKYASFANTRQVRNFQNN